MDNDGPNARHQHSHQDAEYRRVELITGRRRRRDWSAAEKAEILAASMAPESTVTEVARRFEVSRGLLWTWRRKAMDELAAETGPHFVPLRIEEEASESIAVASEALAHIAAMKFAWHLPLHRQVKMLAGQGIDLAGQSHSLHARALERAWGVPDLWPRRGRARGVHTAMACA